MNAEMLRVYMGYDPREELAYRVAEDSIRRYRPGINVVPLKLEKLEAQGLVRRPREIIDGKMWDVNSKAPMSTEFAITRFLPPLLSQSGWALFVDSDIVVYEDLSNILMHADSRYAVMCVKHPALEGTAAKMDGQAQIAYHRKNWSSVMLFNCDHPANRGLTLSAINVVPGKDLHRFFWLDDDEIGELPERWNWLVNVRPRPEYVSIAHFTLGGPWFKDWVAAENDELWETARRDYEARMWVR